MPADDVKPTDDPILELLKEIQDNEVFAPFSEEDIEIIEDEGSDEELPFEEELSDDDRDVSDLSHITGLTSLSEEDMSIDDDEFTEENEMFIQQYANIVEEPKYEEIIELYEEEF